MGVGCGRGPSAVSAGDARPLADASAATDGGADVVGPGDLAGADDAARPDTLGADAAAALDTACTPEIEGRLAPVPLRRLNNFEYTNTLRDLLGYEPADAAPLPAAGDVSSPDVDGLAALATAYRQVAHDVALASAQDATFVASIAPCDPNAAGGEAACAQTFIAGFVARLFRRPLDPDDVTDFADVFAKGRALGGDYASGVRAVIEVALQSPELLYRVEFGEPVDAAHPTLWRPTSYEMATRLGYLLLGSAPDGLLLQAAARNELDTKERIEQQARRLLADRHVRAVTGHFYERLLGAEDLVHRPDLGVRASAAEETARFLEEVVWNADGRWSSLLTAPFSFVNGELAQLYGIVGITGVAFQKATLPPTQRRGLLTQASVLASTTAGVTHPSARGALIWQQLLCGDLPPMPEAAAHVAPPMLAGETRRAWLERVAASGTCASCHAQIDPLGFAFEHYDTGGAWRDADSGAAIDSRVTIAAGDLAGSFDSAVDLIGRLAASPDVQRCQVRKWMEAAYGRGLVAGDACSRGQAEQVFTASGGDIRELLVGLTQTEPFLYYYRTAP